MEHNPLPKEKKRDWLGALLESDFGCCEKHKNIKFNEKTVFCIDCIVSLCKECTEAHSLHRGFKIYKYCYQDVVRQCDLHKYFNCSKIQTYISNNERVVHLKARSSFTKFKQTRKSNFDNVCSESNAREAKVAVPQKCGSTCEGCGKRLQDKRNRFCSVTCKISVIPQNQVHYSIEKNQSEQKFSEDGDDQHDKQNSETESTVSVAEPYECFKDRSLRKRSRKSTPRRSYLF